MAKYPVCGMEVDEATARHEGRTCYFGAPGYKKAFRGWATPSRGGCRCPRGRWGSGSVTCTLAEILKDSYVLGQVLDRDRGYVGHDVLLSADNGNDSEFVVADLTGHGAAGTALGSAGACHSMFSARVLAQETEASSLYSESWRDAVHSPARLAAFSRQRFPSLM